MSITKEIVSKEVSYQVIRPLGAGAAGEVFLVRDPRLSRPLALKLLQKGAMTTGLIAAFKTEFETLARLHHPNLPRVYDFGWSTSHRRYFFTADFIEGGDVYTALQGAPITEIEMVMVQLLDAIDFIHGLKLLHLDIKRGNILIIDEGGGKLAKIVDFGFAVPLERAPTEIVGTFMYMAPEVLMPGVAVDQRSDLYSLGVVFYHLLTGRYPCEAGTVRELLRWHRNRPASLEPLNKADAPEYLKAAVEKMLRPDPSQRFSSAGVLIRYLELQSGKKFVRPERRVRTLLAGEGPLVGRSHILEELKRVVDQTIKGVWGRATTIVITGRLGIGKSRILKEIRYYAQLMEMRVIRIPGDKDLQMQDEPTLLLIDDWERLPDETRVAVTRLVRSAHEALLKKRPCRYLVVITAEMSESATHLFHFGGRLIELPLLDEEEIEDYLRLVMGESPELPGLASHLWQFSGGLPLLVREAVANIESPKELPNITTADLLYKKGLDGLSEGAFKVLVLCTTAVFPLTTEAIEEIVGKDASDILGGLASARFLTYDLETDWWRPVSGALSDVVRNRASGSILAQAADELFWWVDKRSPGSVDLLATYAVQGSDSDRAVKYLLMAADKNEKGFHLNKAAWYLKQVEGLLEAGAARTLPQVRHRLGRLLILAGQCEEARRFFELNLKEDSNSIEDLKALAWTARVRHDPNQAALYINRALELVPADPSDPAYISLRNELAQVLADQDNLDEAEGIFLEGLSQADKLVPEKKKQVVNNNLGMVWAARGRFDEAANFYRQKLKFFAGDQRLVGSILSQLGLVYMQAGDDQSALESFVKSWQIAKEIGDIHNAMPVLDNIISLYQRSAAYSSALEYAHESLDLGIWTRRDLARNLYTIATLYVSLGVHRLAQAYLFEAIAIFRSDRDRLNEGWAMLSLGYLHRARRETGEAMADFDAVCEIGRQLKDELLLMWSYYAAADLLLEMGEHKKASERLAKCLLPSNVPELAIRLNLLEIKLDIARGGSSPQTPKRLKEMIVICGNKGWLELAWEGWHALGRYYKNRPASALEAFLKAGSIIDSIASGLAEEYRDSFKKDRLRIEVAQDLQELSRRSAEAIKLIPSAEPLKRLSQFRHKGGEIMDTLKVILDITRELNTEYDLDRLLTLIVDYAIELSGAERGLLLLYEDGQFNAKVARNVDKSNIETIEFSRSIALDVASTGEAIVSVDAASDLELAKFKSVVSLKLKSVVCVPLRIKGRLAGVLYLDNSLKVGCFDKDTVELLGFFADQAAVALTNAQGILEKDKYQRKLEEKLVQMESTLAEAETRLDETRAQISEASTRRETRYNYDQIVGTSEAIVHVLRILDKVTDTKAPVMIVGETGTGKELIAKALHFNSSRKPKRLVAINCAALPEGILESELFGYMKGAFTGADRDRPGLFEQACGGTLFLDEIGDMTPSMQAKILRAIQEQEIMRLGGRQTVPIDVRIVSASNRDVKKLVEEGKFREDLFYRIGQLIINLPPLREHLEDLPLLVKHIMKKIKEDYGIKRDFKVDQGAIGLLLSHSWPGNIRELEQVLTNACLLAERSIIGAKDINLPAAMRHPLPEPTTGAPLVKVPPFDPTRKLGDYEADIIREALRHFEGNKSKAAIALGITRMTLTRKMGKYGIK